MARWALVLSACLLAAGCATKRMAVEKALREAGPSPVNLESRYLVRFPDTLEVRVGSRPDCCGTRPVTVEGTVWLGGGAEVPVSGLPAPDIARLIARELNVPDADVTVRVARYESQQLFLVGPNGAIQEALPYRGPETVVDLLRRAGKTREADLLDVRVIRPHVADGLLPEVFLVDLHAILVNQEAKTNVRLMPGDRVQVGQSPPERVCCKLPPWLKPLWRKLMHHESAEAP
jgi:protein involved in polysaccharide export with SLBB domain